jgi:DNA processing protein
LDTNLSVRDETHAWLRLTLVPGVGRQAQRNLLEAFGTARQVLEAQHAAICALVGDEAARLLADGPKPALLESTLRWLERPGCRLVTTSDAVYPAALRHISDAPIALYVQGRVELLNKPAFAIVGSRNATPQGRSDAEAFARELSDAGLTIVSGLALGIDAAAHRGGLAGAGSSIAVMGTGPDILYPSRNSGLARTLAERGCLITEFAVGIASLPENFPQRNRLISGLCKGVLVAEASWPRSGSLITARCALEQGRDVFAIPGSIHSPLSKGCHWLIKEGAKLVESADDVLCELGMKTIQARRAGARQQPNNDPLLEAMGFAPASIDQIAQRSGLDAATLAARLSRLEIAGRVEALAGGWFQRVEKRVIE